VNRRGIKPADARVVAHGPGHLLDNHHLHLLQLACEAFDRCQQARRQLADFVAKVGDFDCGRLVERPSSSALGGAASFDQS
jgi:hypothetical protein